MMMSKKELLLQWVRKNRLENTLLDAVMSGILELREVDGETLFGMAVAPSAPVAQTTSPVHEALPLPPSNDETAHEPEPEPVQERHGVHSLQSVEPARRNRKVRRFKVIPNTLADVEEWSLIVCRQHGTHLNCYVSPSGQHVSKEECLCNRGKAGFNVDCPIGEHAGKALVSRHQSKGKKGKIDL